MAAISPFPWQRGLLCWGPMKAAHLVKEPVNVEAPGLGHELPRTVFRRLDGLVHVPENGPELFLGEQHPGRLRLLGVPLSDAVAGLLQPGLLLGRAGCATPIEGGGGGGVVGPVLLIRRRALGRRDASAGLVRRARRSPGAPPALLIRSAVDAIAELMDGGDDADTRRRRRRLLRRRGSGDAPPGWLLLGGGGDAPPGILLGEGGEGSPGWRLLGGGGGLAVRVDAGLRLSL